MPITSLDLLDSAKRCHDECNEVGFRNAISRAYYSMYHEALGSLTSVPTYESNHHSNLIFYLTNKSENKSEPYDSLKMKGLGYRLKQQRNARNDADYQIADIEVTSEMANEVIESAKLFFDDWAEMKAVKAS